MMTANAKMETVPYVHLSTMGGTAITILFPIRNGPVSLLNRSLKNILLKEASKHERKEKGKYTD